MAGQVFVLGDIYSYGVLLLEMFTGKRPTDDMFKVKELMEELVWLTYQNQCSVLYL